MRFLVALALGLAACPAPQPPPSNPSKVVVTTTVPDAPPVRSTKGLEPGEPKLRLPKNFTPTGYTAKLSIDPAKPVFDGAITIAGNVSERSSVIWLHGRHLTV